MAQSALPEFDDLYAISDLHMGGKPGFQMMTSGALLGKFIDHLTKDQPDRRVALVVNGDVIDSLAEDSLDGYISVSRVGDMMHHLFTDPGFAPVWTALADFVNTARRYLVVGIGNHDIEVALPPVEHSIRTRLAKTDGANGRIIFATRGEGFSCMVGGARVLCTHGNEVDDLNCVDHEELRALSAELNAGKSFNSSAWKPNFGTRFVIDVMNDLKKNNPFVDLLQPEQKATIAILTTLDPDAMKKLPGLIRAAGRAIRDKFLSGDIEAQRGAAAPALVLDERQLLGANLRNVIEEQSGGSAAGSDVDRLLLDVDSQVRGGQSASDAARAAGAQGTLGGWQLTWDRIRGVDKKIAVQAALKDWMHDNNSFELDQRDETCIKTLERVGSDVHFVVTGHTHLERALRIDKGVNRFYYNSGTWAGTLRLTGKMLEGKPYDDLWSALETRKRAPLAPFVSNRYAMVRISSDAQGATGGLYYVEDGPGGKGVKLNLAKGSTFSRT